MTAIVDAGAVIAAAVGGGPEAEHFRRSFVAERGRLIVPAPVTAEIDYLLTKSAGQAAALGFIEDVSAGRFEVECLEPAEYATVLQLTRRYKDLAPGLADLSVVILAHRFQTLRVFTVDQRHFRAMYSLDGSTFTLVPWDDPEHR